MSGFVGVVSRGPAETLDLRGRSAGEAGHPGRRQLEGTAAETLGAAGAVEVLIVPHLYHLTIEHPAAERLAALDADLVVATWLHPRAAYWTLRALGAGSDRRVAAHGLAEFANLEECAERLSAGAAGECGSGVRPVEVDGLMEPRWYPVIDYMRCVDCGQCMEFCLFGVYSKADDGRVAATRPEACKPGCPACARVCPNGAIMFPEYAAEPTIAGADARTGDDVERCPVCGCACDCERSDDGSAPVGKSVCPACGCICECAAACECRPGPEAPERDDLDDLINALEKLDV